MLRVALRLLLLCLLVLFPQRAWGGLAPAAEARVFARDAETRVKGEKVQSVNCTYRKPLTTPQLHLGNPSAATKNVSTLSFRWKGRWWNDFGGPAGTYDMRARVWSPELAVFLSIDEFAYHDARSTLWGWPGQNPLKYADPSGRNPFVIALFFTLPLVLAADSGPRAEAENSRTPLMLDVLGGIAAEKAIGFAAARFLKPALEAALGPELSAFAKRVYERRAARGVAALAEGDVGANCKAAMSRVRAACPDGHCLDLSQRLVSELGDGEVIAATPLGRGPLPTLPGVAPPGGWGHHAIVRLPTGQVADPLRNVLYDSTADWPTPSQHLCVWHHHD